MGVVENILGCRANDLSIKYLGLPLSDRRPNRVDFLPMIAAVEARVASWKSALLSYGGRLTLIKSVLSSLPLHYMQALKVPKWVFEKIDRIRHSFLWKGQDVCKPINCLVNWEKTCALKENGGLGIIHFQNQNDALLTKWIWICQSNRQSSWAMTIRNLYGIETLADISAAHNISFFLREIHKLMPFHEASIRVNPITQETLWRWEASGKFTTSSAYRMMHHTGVICPYHNRLWKIKCPPKVKVFLWVLLQHKLLTRGILMRRGCQTTQGCMLCGGAITETDVHLFWTCAYSALFWQSLLASYNCNQRVTGTTTHINLWLRISVQLNSRGRTIWDTVWAAGLWALWRERNNRIFNQRSKSLQILVSETRYEIRQWREHC